MKDVVIVGAGPVGLTVAEILGNEGYNVMVLEKNAELSKEWRASTFHPGTMELLEMTGLTEEMIKQGFKAEKIQYRDRKDGLYAEFDLTDLSDTTKYPYRLQLPQSTYVKIVNESLLKKSNVTVKYNSELINFTQNEDFVELTYQSGEEQHTVQTKFLLGSDGARSTVRKKLELNFEGFTYPQRFLLVGTPIDFRNYLPDIEYVNYVSDPDEFLFILKVPEAWRLLYPVKDELSDEEALKDENLQKQLQKALNTTDTFPIVERMIYRVHQRVAERYYSGRVVLLGDAAHVNSPMGGLGLNSGIHDAVDLSIRLKRIFENEENGLIKAELECYNEARRTVSINYVKQISEKNTNVMKETQEELRKQLQQEYTKMANDKAQARQWMLRSAMISSVREQGIGEPPKVNS
ncbi:FAD-dependent monooxygenase [Lysinibacillus fusiformis]|nr:FAD-dependent monooxygenase [Lysinibacillus fusiformis]